MQTDGGRLGRVQPALAGAAVVAALAGGAYGPSLAGLAARAPNWSLIAEEGFALKLHLAAALGTLLVGVLLLAGVKGRSWHKRLGWSWVALMAATAASSFWLQHLRPGSFSWIHGLSGWTLVALPAAVYAARRRKVRLHRRAMTRCSWAAPSLRAGSPARPGVCCGVSCSDKENGRPEGRPFRRLTARRWCCWRRRRFRRPGRPCRGSAAGAAESWAGAWPPAP